MRKGPNLENDVITGGSSARLNLSQLLGEVGTTSNAVAAAERLVRQHPTAFEARWQLFQWLCIVGAWTRSLGLLQVAAQLKPDFASRAHLYRELVRSEVFRSEVFEGKREPGTLMPMPDWLGRLREAATRSGAGDACGADRIRNLALAEAPMSVGDHDGTSFAWMTDSDTRLGPTCELVSAGRYTWLPFSQVRKLAMPPVEGLLDLIWRPVTATLMDDTVVHGFVPVRYPGSEHGSDEIRLSRQTQWLEFGNTGVFGRGQKTWMTNKGDIGMLDVDTLSFTVANRD
ncbi:ImpE protein superfamily protein [Cupriavidus sp. SW-Y-13]|nr:ImpE protein superfamily protein [Cupriavidus sp. SW-Y-13]